MAAILCFSHLNQCNQSEAMGQVVWSMFGLDLNQHALLIMVTVVSDDINVLFIWFNNVHAGMRNSELLSEFRLFKVCLVYNLFWWYYLVFSK